MQQAKDKLTKVGFIDGLFGSGKSSRQEDAADLYIKAANQYKLAKAWQKAGDAFYHSASLALELEFGSHKASTGFQQAAECYGKLPKNAKNTTDISNCLSQACEIMLKEGKFSNAGKVKEQLAAMAEEENRLTDAMILYEKAADYHEADTFGKSSTNTCLIKVGNLAASCSEYTKAIDCFEKVAQNYLTNPLMVFKVKPLWVDAGICRVGLDDIVSLKKAVGKYCEIQPDFVKSREFQFLDALISAIDNQDGAALGACVTEYDSYQKIARWATAILIQVKDKLDNPPDDDFS